jgi:hypothetical protein
MDYTAGGELFERIREQERFSEGGVTPHYPSMSFEYFIVPYLYVRLCISLTSVFCTLKSHCLDLQ